MAGFQDLWKMYSFILVIRCGLFKIQEICQKHIFFDNAYLLKKVRNNILNWKKFTIPTFNFTIGDILKFAGKYIAWGN